MRIGVDVDGVLTNIEKYQLHYGKKYFKNMKEEDLNLNEYDVEQIFNCSHKERNKFWTKYIFDYCIHEEMRRDASLVLNALHDEGDEIFIITGRVHTKEKGFVGFLFRRMLYNWLKKNNIPYKKIIYCEEKGSEVDKLEACKENNIDIMIDDKKENIVELSKITNVLCFDALYNQECSGNKITRVHNFNEVYSAIQKIKHPNTFEKMSDKEIDNMSNKEKINYYQKLKEYYLNLPYDYERIQREEKIYINLSKIGKPIFDKKFKPKEFNKEFIPEQNGVIFASNHNNYYDQFPIICSLGYDKPVHFLTAMKMLNLKRGKIYMKSGVIPVDRNDKNDRKRSSDEMKKILLNGGNVGIFPEGRTNRNENYLLEFHTGAVDVAQVTGCPIVPVAVNDFYNKEDGELCVRFGEPFYVSPLDDKYEMTELLKEKIATLKWENMEYNYQIERERVKQKVK